MSKDLRIGVVGVGAGVTGVVSRVTVNVPTTFVMSQLEANVFSFNLYSNEFALFPTSV